MFGLIPDLEPVVASRFKVFIDQCFFLYSDLSRCDSSHISATASRKSAAPRRDLGVFLSLSASAEAVV